ncbi:uncharacterized protein LOC143035903 [Oratosquilla oratoria]|uniref:uncharacterized protein LOC143035903 n=1 Tax=Oratosquilla oratoria TaxID=337810 RepID=UPI003F75FFE3
MTVPLAERNSAVVQQPTLKPTATFPLQALSPTTMTTSMQDTHAVKMRSAPATQSYRRTRSQSAPSFSQREGEQKTSSSSSPHLSSAPMTTKDVWPNRTRTSGSNRQLPSGSLQNNFTTNDLSTQGCVPAPSHSTSTLSNHHDPSISSGSHSSCKAVLHQNNGTMHDHATPHVKTNNHTMNTTLDTPVPRAASEMRTPPSEKNVSPILTTTDQVNSEYKRKWISFLQKSKRPIFFERPWLSLTKAKAGLKDVPAQHSNRVSKSVKNTLCDDGDGTTSVDDPTTLSVTSISEVNPFVNEVPPTGCESHSHKEDTPNPENEVEQKCPTHDGKGRSCLHNKTLYVTTLDTSLEKHSLPESNEVIDNVVSPRFDQDGSPLRFGNSWILLVIVTIVLAFIIVLPLKNKPSESSSLVKSSSSRRDANEMVSWVTGASMWACILAVIGGVGNLVTIATICHQLILGRGRNSFYCASPPISIKLDGDTLLILHLSFCDFLYCTVNLPLTAYTYFTYSNGPGRDFCRGAAIFRYLNAFVEWNTLALLAVERCVDLRRSHRSRLFRPKTTLLLLLLVWVVSIILLLPAIIHDGFDHDKHTYKCDMMTKWCRFFFYTLETFLPCLLMTWGCISIVDQIYRNKQLLASTGMSPTVVAERGRRMWKSSAMTLGLLLLFMACVVPICVYNVMYALDKTVCVEAGIIIFAFYWIQFGVNFLIYAASNAAYRKAFLVFFSAVARALLKSCSPYLEKNPEVNGDPRITPPSSLVADPSSV